MKGIEIIEEIDFLKAQGEGKQRISEILAQATVKPASLRVLLRRHSRDDLLDFLFAKEPHEPVVHEHGNRLRYVSGCRCSLCKEANAGYAMKQRKERAGRLKDPADPRHGTVAFYSNHGCRCSRCSEAHRICVARRYAERVRDSK